MLPVTFMNFSAKNGTLRFEQLDKIKNVEILPVKCDLSSMQKTRLHTLPAKLSVS